MAIEAFGEGFPTFKRGVLKPLTVQFKFYSTMREVIGRETLKLRLRQGATIEAALEILIRRYGDTLRQKLSQKRNWVIMLNDRNITFLEDMETKLNDGDQIAILSPLSGG